MLPLLEERDPSQAARGRFEYDIRWPPFTNYEVEKDKAINLFYLASYTYGDGSYSYRE